MEDKTVLITGTLNFNNGDIRSNLTQTIMLKRHNDECIGYWIKDFKGEFCLLEWFNETSPLGFYLKETYNLDYSKL